MAGVFQEAGDAHLRARNPKCKLIILLFLTLPHILDCLICTRNAMSIVLLLQLMGDPQGEGGWLILRRGCSGNELAIFFFFHIFVFCCLTFSVLLFRYLGG